MKVGDGEVASLAIAGSSEYSEAVAHHLQWQRRLDRRFGCWGGSPVWLRAGNRSERWCVWVVVTLEAVRAVVVDGG